MAGWQPPGTAPKDKVFLGIVAGYPYATVMVWNNLEEGWAYAEAQADMFNGVFEDFYFDTNYSKQLIKWMELPN